MSHWRRFMDEKEFLYAFDLQGSDVTVQIEKITGGEVTGENGRKSKKPKCFFKGKKKPLMLNITNCKTLSMLTGSDEIEDWVGQWITLYPTTCQSKSGETVACIRIRPKAPKNAPGGNAPSTPEPTPDPQASESSSEPAAADQAGI